MSNSKHDIQVGDLCYVQDEKKYYLIKDITFVHVVVMDVVTGEIQNLFKSNFVDKVLKKVS
jgi:hypothetical protein